ncbi:UNVERIFIED_CONTAM: hypothetical protein HDU68_009141, partial [Siphonaria sp. JEL0065]
TRNSAFKTYKKEVKSQSHTNTTVPTTANHAGDLIAPITPAPWAPQDLLSLSPINSGLDYLFASSMPLIPSSEPFGNEYTIDTFMQTFIPQSSSTGFLLTSPPLLPQGLPMMEYQQQQQAIDFLCSPTLAPETNVPEMLDSFLVSPGLSAIGADDGTFNTFLQQQEREYQTLLSPFSLPQSASLISGFENISMADFGFPLLPPSGFDSQL